MNGDILMHAYGRKIIIGCMQFIARNECLLKGMKIKIESKSKYRRNEGVKGKRETEKVIIGWS